MDGARSAKAAEPSTAYELIDRYRRVRPDGHFFDKATLKFFGERPSEMLLLKRKAEVTDSCGVQHECYVLSAVQHNYPGGVRRTYHYFDKDTLEDIIPGEG